MDRIVSASGRHVVSVLSARAGWPGLSGAALLHAAVAAALLAWPAHRAAVVDPVTAVELLLAPAPVEEPPAPLPSPMAEPPPVRPVAAKPAAVSRPVPAPAATGAAVAAASTPAAAEIAAAAGPPAPPASAVQAPPAAQAGDPDRPAAAVQQPRPFYPRVARQRGWQGMVVLRVAVDETGHPCEVAVRDSSGHAVLDEAALDAVRQWRFAPARQGGRLITAAIDVPVRFSLTEG